jgi:hypothetical protein
MAKATRAMVTAMKSAMEMVARAMMGRQCWVIVVAAAAMKTAAVTAEARTTAMVATALVTIVLVALAIAHFVTRNVVANAIAHVVAVAIAFVSMQQRGQWQGQQEQWQL